MPKREECRILPNDPSIPTAGLGQYVDGYESSLRPKPMLKTIVFGVLALFFLIAVVSAVVEPGFWESEYAFLILGAEIVFLVVFLFLALWPWIFQNRNRVYVFEEGFVWTKERRNGKVIKEEKFDLNKIDGIIFSKKSLNDEGGDSTGYYFAIIVNQMPVFKRRGSYTDPEYGGWDYFALQSISQQWKRIGTNRMKEELRTKGSLQFDDIILTNEYIRKEGIAYSWDDLCYTFDGDTLVLDRVSKNKKFLNFSHDVIVDINNMMNGELFFVAMNDLLKIGLF